MGNLESTTEFPASSSRMLAASDAALKGDLKTLYQLAIEGTQELAGFRDKGKIYSIMNNTWIINDMIAALIMNGANVNARDEEGLTALHLAASGQHPIAMEVVKLLLRRGADARAVDLKGNTPLHRAIFCYDSAIPAVLVRDRLPTCAERTDDAQRFGAELYCRDLYTEIIPSLIRAGANVNARCERGFTPLHLAANCGHPFASEVARTLISFGADVNATDNNDETPLHRSIGQFDEKVTRVLLERGADIEAVNNIGNTPLGYTCLFDHTNNARITRLLLKHGANINARQYNGFYPLNCAALSEHNGDAKIDALVEYGVDVNSVGPAGMVPMFSAVCNPHEEAPKIIKALVRHGANVNDKLKDGKSMLHVAVTNENTMVVKEMLNQGANVNAIESIGQTPLIALSGNKHPNVVEVARLLVSKGAHVNMPDFGGFTPLHSAASVGNEPLVKFLIEEAKACPYLTNTQGHTPLKLASENGFKSIVEYLLNISPVVGKQSESQTNTANLNDLLFSAARHGRLRTLQHLILEGGELSYRDPLSLLTVEEIAHMRGHSDVAWFANKALRGNVRGIRQRPEMILCKSSLSMEDQLAMEGSDDVNAFVTVDIVATGVLDMHYQDEKGRTHLHNYVEKNNLVGVFNLLDRQALVTAKTHDGLTPLDLANDLGRAEIAEKLSNRLQTFRDNEFTSDVIKIRYYTMVLSIINHCISITSRHENDDAEAQNQKMCNLKNASWLISLGVPLEPPGSHHVSVLHLAITSNCKPILTMLLAAGAPLYVTHNGLGPVETAWLTPDVTTWIAVTVTRAMVNKLKANIPRQSSNSSDKTLAAIINGLIINLNSNEPWKTKYHCITNSSRITDDVVFRACEKGLTLPLWWMWSRKTNSFVEDSTGRTPLHVALDSNNFETARALVIHMKANPFIPDNSGRVPVDMLPSNIKTTMIMQCLMREFQHFDGNIQRLKDPNQIREEQQLVLLLLVLFLYWEEPARGVQWQDFHSRIASLLPDISVVDGKLCFSTDWIVGFNDRLKEIGNIPQSGVEREISDYYRGLGLCGDDLSEFLKNLNDEYYMINEPEDFHILLSLLQTFLQRVREEVLSSGKNGTTHIPSLLKKGLKKCCERKLPLFLHLLVKVAKVDTDTVIDDICDTRAIHHCAINDNMSATMYLKASGFPVKRKDRYGRTPSHFAYMYGNKDIGDYLKAGIEETKTESGLDPGAMWDAYKKYLNLYGIDLQKINKPEFNECNNSDDLIGLHLNALVNKWEGKGVTEAVKKAKVDYCSGESLEVFTCIKDFLTRLLEAVGEKEPLLSGRLVFVGSSEDNVRLTTPDEYDCNFVLENFSCYPHGRCKMMLQEVGSRISYVDKKINISFESPEIHDFFYGTNLSVRFSETMKECLQNFTMQDKRLSITPTSLKQTLVGTALRFSWNGSEFPLLLIDVDIVPVIRSPWPSELKKPALTPEIDEVFINKLGRDEWRFSFAQAENMIMKKLSRDEKVVYLACKMVIGSMKTEGWMQQQLKDQFQFWDGRKMKIPLPNGFLLKSAFFFEKEEVTDELLWKERNLLDRMCSIFRRMCNEMERSPGSVYVPGKVQAYFGRRTQEQGVGYGAPVILRFLENWNMATNIIGRLYDYFRENESTL